MKKRVSYSKLKICIRNHEQVLMNVPVKWLYRIEKMRTGAENVDTLYLDFFLEEPRFAIMARGIFSYQEKLRRLGLLKKAEEWLDHNPPPPGCEDRYAWAYLEMPSLEVSDEMP